MFILSNNSLTFCSVYQTSEIEILIEPKTPDDHTLINILHEILVLK